MLVNQTPHKPYIIFDIDGTVADDSHRAVHVQAPLITASWSPNWEKYHEGMEKDKLHNHIAQIYYAMCYGRGTTPVNPTIFITGRPESHRKVTLEWLQLHDMIPDYLFMRPDGDFSSSVELKSRIVHDHVGEAPVLFVIEDRAKVVKMWRGMGYNCLQCADGDY